MSIEFLSLLLLIIIANGVPILIRRLLNNHFNLAIDFGQCLTDNHRLFGPSKTWRGFLASLFATTISAGVLGLSAETGMLVATYAIAGDLVSSFIKRRLAMAPSSMAPLLDQLPESLLPAVMLKEVFHLDMSAVILLVLIFVIIDFLLSHILYRYGVRKKPY